MTIMSVILMILGTHTVQRRSYGSPVWPRIRNLKKHVMTQLEVTFRIEALSSDPFEEGKGAYLGR